ncbi:MAG: hypothetical protein H0T13_03580, partial [Actinobacteria bacterium]|nr:hypothetical protein [Actinomycetota bacterium]
MRRFWLVTTAAAAGLMIAVGGAVAHGDDGDGDIKDHSHFREQALTGTRYDADPKDRGLQLWDATDPAHPAELGFLDTGCCTRGVHEFEVQHRSDLGDAELGGYDRSRGRRLRHPQQLPRRDDPVHVVV